jgi:signal transduction histidine kinase/ActR/RegA family two-component response regulator
MITPDLGESSPPAVWMRPPAPREPPPVSGLVVVFSPVGQDGPMIAKVLQRAGMQTEVCATIESLCNRLVDADTAIIAEETLDERVVSCLTEVLARQPRWSDFPLIVLGVPDSLSSDAVFDLLSPVANLTLLERPTRPFTLVTVTRAALRSRGRQHLTREHLDELTASRLEAERMGRMKDEFLATLSHELRTPLNAISGWSDLLKRGVLSPEDREKAVEIIWRNTKAQRQLIDELLDMSRIIAGKVRLDVQPTDLASVMSDAVDSVRPAAEAKGITLTCRLPEARGAVPPLSLDAARVQQVAWNLLTNAIKFTPAGGRVELTVERRGDEALVRVTDTGAGIPAEFLPFVFDRFRQADSSSRRSYGGLGLGLSIVKQLVEMHGGSVAVESAGEGRGAAFTVRLPIAPGAQRAGSAPRRTDAAAAPSRPASVSVRGVSVLVVDDDNDGRELVRRFLEDAEATVYTAASVADARTVLRDRDVGVLLSDIAMPEEDGYDLIRWLRSSGEPRLRSLPACALSAFARPEDRARALASGYDDHLGKPVRPDTLIQAVDALRQRGRGGRPPGRDV